MIMLCDTTFNSFDGISFLSPFHDDEMGGKKRGMVESREGVGRCWTQRLPWSSSVLPAARKWKDPSLPPKLRAPNYLAGELLLP